VVGEVVVGVGLGAQPVHELMVLQRDTGVQHESTERRLVVRTEGPAVASTHRQKELAITGGDRLGREQVLHPAHQVGLGTVHDAPAAGELEEALVGRGQPVVLPQGLAVEEVDASRAPVDQPRLLGSEDLTGLCQQHADHVVIGHGLADRARELVEGHEVTGLLLRAAHRSVRVRGTRRERHTSW